MGMIVQMRRAPDGDLTSLPSAGDGASRFVMPEDRADPAYSDGSILDLGKTWHAIHFLLANEIGPARLPAGFIFAGQPVGDNMSYGPVRVLNSLEVEQINGHLKSLATDFAVREFDFDRLAAAQIYPAIWDRRDPDDLNWVTRSFDSLRKFIAEAGAAKQGIALVIF